MPRSDGTGPAGKRPGNRTEAWVKEEAGAVMGGAAMGPGDDCVCPQCGHTQPHQRGVPCLQIKCPQCGAALKPPLLRRSYGAK